MSLFTEIYKFLNFTLRSLDIQTINEDETSGIAFPNACVKETLPGQIFEMQGQTVHSECKYIMDKNSHNFLKHFTPINCSRVWCIIQFYCLGLEAGFCSDMVEWFAFMSGGSIWIPPCNWAFHRVPTKLWKSWKTWKIKRKSSMRRKIMEFEKTWIIMEKSWNSVK